MPFNPYPSAEDLSREASAIRRDLEDLASLHQQHVILTTALKLARQCEEIRHPDHRYTTADLTEALEGLLTDIDGERQRIRHCGVVLGEG
jgi:hypothetical protein